MASYEQYKSLMEKRGLEETERNRQIIKRDFKKILQTAGNSHLIKYYKSEDIVNDYYEEEQVLIEDAGNYAKTSGLDAKKLLCLEDSNLKTGVYIEFNDMTWLVVAQDIASATVYRKYTIRPCYAFISSRVGEVVVNYPVVFESISNAISTKTVGNDSGFRFQVDYSIEQMVIPDDDIFDELVATDKRIMVNNEKVYVVKKNNKFLSDGVSYATIKQDLFQDDDNIEDNIANDKLPENNEIPDNIEYYIDIVGEQIAKIGTTNEYNIKLMDSNTEEELPPEILLNSEENDNIDEDFNITKITIEALTGENIENIIDNILLEDFKLTFTVLKNVKNINKKLLIKATRAEHSAELIVAIKGVM